MADLGGLKERIDRIVTDLNATRTETYTVYDDGSRPGYTETSGGGYWNDVPPSSYKVTETVPDESRRNKGKQELEELIKDTEPTLLMQVPKPAVLDRMGEVYGSAITPELISAFAEQKAKPLRRALVKFADERALTVLRDASEPEAYVQLFKRLNSGVDVLLQTLQGKIQPEKFRSEVIDYIRKNLFSVVTEAELEQVVRDTEPTLLMQVPEPIVLDKVGKVYGADATPHLIRAFAEQKAEPLRNALSKFGDERSLPVLWQEIVSKRSLKGDYFATTDYLRALARIKGQYEFIRMIVNDDKIQPSGLRQDAHDYFAPPGATAFSKEFWDAFILLRKLVEPNYWKSPFNDFRLALMFVEKNPQIIKEVFDHPNPEEKWYFDDYDPSTRFSSLGDNTVPIFMDAINSDHFPDKIRAYAAVELRRRNDPETNKRLLEMMGGPNGRYAAKALTRSAYGREYKDFARKQPDVWPGTIEAFFSHWNNIDEIDWKLTLSSDRSIFKKELLPRLVGILTDENQEAELKKRSLDLIIKFFSYQGGKYRINDETIEYGAPIDGQQRQEILSYVVGKGYEERADFVQLFRKSGFGVENLQYVGNLARDPNQDLALRLRAINVLGELGVQYRGYKTFNEVRKYLKRVGSSLFGRFFEPNKEIRLAAKEAYAKIK